MLTFRPDLAHPGFDDPKPDLTGADVLLRNQDPDRCVALLTVGALQRLERALDVAEIALGAGIRLEQRIDFRLRNQRVALDDIGPDVEAGRILGDRQAKLEREKYCTSP